MNTLTLVEDLLGPVLLRAAACAVNATDACAVLAVLPRATAPPLLLSFVLALDLPALRPHLAVKHGHGLELLPKYPLGAVVDDLDPVLRAAAIVGDVPVLDWAMKYAGPEMPMSARRWNKHQLWGNVGAAGDLAVLKWCHSNAGDPVPWDFGPTVARSAAEAGHVALLEYLVAECGLHHPPPPNVVTTLANFLPPLELLMASFPLKGGPIEMLAAAAAKGQVQVLEWWWQERHPWAPSSSLVRRSYILRTAERATWTSQLVVLQFLDARFPGWSPDASKFVDFGNWALQSGSVAMAEYWVARHRQPLSMWSMLVGWRVDQPFCTAEGLVHALGTASVPLLEWMAQKFLFSRDLCCTSKVPGQALPVSIDDVFRLPAHWEMRRLSVAALNWWWDLSSHYEQRWFTNLTHVAAKAGRVDWLDWVWADEKLRKRIKFDQKKIAAIALECSKLAVLEWLWARRDKLPGPAVWKASDRTLEMCAIDEVIVWWHERYPLDMAQLQRLLAKSWRMKPISMWLRIQTGTASLLDQRANLLDLMAAAGTEGTSVGLLNYWRSLSEEYGLPFIMPHDEVFARACGSHRPLALIDWWLLVCPFSPDQLAAAAPKGLGAALLPVNMAVIEWWAVHLAAVDRPMVFSADAKLTYLSSSDVEWIASVPAKYGIQVFQELADGRGGRRPFNVTE
ncbi:hypothetical protein BC828DRAFT_390143 [Blastocladiella britannica]|nr:hypothetical protein BC828DRAFT_390143 [Blastocladiella britannica]